MLTYNLTRVFLAVALTSGNVLPGWALGDPMPAYHKAITPRTASVTTFKPATFPDASLPISLAQMSEVVSESAIITNMVAELQAAATAKGSFWTDAPTSPPTGPGTINAVQVDGTRVYGAISTGGYTVTITLKTGHVVKAVAAVWPNNDLKYWVDLPARILPGDTVEVNAGDNTVTIPVTPLTATLNYQSDVLLVGGLPGAAVFRAELRQPGYGDYSFLDYATIATATLEGTASVAVFGDGNGNGAYSPNWQADAYGIVRYTQPGGHQVFRVLKSTTFYVRGNRVNVGTAIANSSIVLTLYSANSAVKKQCAFQSGFILTSVWLYETACLYTQDYVLNSTPVQVEPGDMLQLSWDGETTQMLVPPLLASANKDLDTVSGLGLADSSHRAWVWKNNQAFYSDVVADSVGNYTATNPFFEYGYASGLGQIDLQAGDRGRVCTGLNSIVGAQACVAFGVMQHRVQVDGVRVEGVVQNFEQVTVTLRTGDVIQTVKTIWPANDLTYQADLDHVILPNDTVEVYVDGINNLISVTPLTATLNYQTDVLSVGGLPGAATLRVELTSRDYDYVLNQPGNILGYVATLTANAAGTAEVSVFGDAGGHGAYTPNWTASDYGLVRHILANGNQVFRVLKTATVHVGGNRVDVGNVIVNTQVVLTVYSASSEVKQTCSFYTANAVTTIWLYTSGCSQRENNGAIMVTIDPGDVVRLTWNGEVTDVPVQMFAVNANFSTDAISGIGLPNTEYRVWVWQPASGFFYTDVVANATGNFVAVNPFRLWFWYVHANYVVDIKTDDRGKVCAGLSPISGLEICQSYAVMQHRVQVDGFRVEGITSNPGPLTVTLKTGATIKAVTTTTPANDLSYWANFSTRILPGDTVEVLAGGVTATISVIPLTATLDYQADVLHVGGLPSGAYFQAELLATAGTGRWWDYWHYMTTTTASPAGVAHVSVFGDSSGHGAYTPDWPADAHGTVRYTQPDGHQVFRTLNSINLFVRGNVVSFNDVIGYSPISFTLYSANNAVKIVCTDLPQYRPYPHPMTIWLYANNRCPDWPWSGHTPVIIQPGDTLMVEWDGVTTTISVPLISVNTSVSADTVFGTGRPYASHQVWVGDYYTSVVADALGAYTATNPFRFWYWPPTPTSIVDIQNGDSGRVCTGISPMSGAQVCANYVAAEVTVALDAGLREGNLGVIGRAIPGSQVEIWDITTHPAVRLDDGACFANSVPTNARFTCALTQPLVYNHVIIAIANGYSSAARWVGRALTLHGPATSNSSFVQVYGFAPVEPPATTVVQVGAGVTHSVSVTAEANGLWNATLNLPPGVHVLTAHAGGYSSLPITVVVGSGLPVIGPSTVQVDGNVHTTNAHGRNAFNVFVVVPVSPITVSVIVDNLCLGGQVQLAFLNQTVTAVASGAGHWQAVFANYPLDGGLHPITARISGCGPVIEKQIAEPFLLIDPSGHIYDAATGDAVTGARLSGAVVTLYRQYGGAWYIWPAGAYGQSNPQISDTQGRYGFMVPPGRYYVVAEQSGYAPNQSQEYDIPPEVTNAHIGLMPHSSGGSNRLHIVTFAGDQPLTAPYSLAPLYPELLASIVQNSVGQVGLTVVLLADLERDSDTHIRVVQNGAMTTLVGLPNTQGVLEVNRREYDMTDGATLGGFLAWARTTYGAGARVTWSYIGHGTAVAPQADLNSMVFPPAAPDLPDASQITEAAFPMPSQIGGHPGWTDWTPQPGVVSPRALAQALAQATNHGQDPIDVLDLVHCFAATLEEFAEVAPYAAVLVGSPNYTYFEPGMGGAVVAALGATANPTQTANAIVQVYHHTLLAADDPSTPYDDHPHILVAVDSSQISAVVQAWNAVTWYLMERLTSDTATTRAQLLDAYLAASKYDTCGTTWDCAAPDALVDLSFALALIDSFGGDTSDVGFAANTTYLQAEAAVITRAVASGTPWFTAPSQPLWNFDSNLGLALFAPFQTFTLSDNTGVNYLPWQTHWYANATFTFTAQTDWDEVIAAFWAGQNVETHFCLPVTPVAPRPGELSVTQVIFPARGSVAVNTPAHLAAAISVTAIPNTLVRFTVFQDGAETFSITVGTGYLPAGEHMISAGPAWTPVAVGNYTITVEADVDNRIIENDETNNRLTTLTDRVWPTLPRPVITAQVSGGQQFIADSSVALNLAQSAGQLPVHKVVVQLYGYVPGASPQTYLPQLLTTTTLNNVSLPWVNFNVNVFPQAGSGPRELHIWGYSAAGVSNPVIVRFNYAPTATLSMGAHYFLFESNTGDVWQFNLTVTTGDANLFVWAPYSLGFPDWQATAMGNDVLTIITAPSGQYVLSVQGQAMPATYHLSATRNGQPALTSSMVSDSYANLQASIPFLAPVFIAPIPLIPSEESYLLFLPLVQR